MLTGSLKPQKTMERGWCSILQQTLADGAPKGKTWTASMGVRSKEIMFQKNK